MMKFLLMVLSTGIAITVQAQQQLIVATKDTIVKVKDVHEVIEFRNANHDLGKIPFGKAVEYVLEMKNISKDSVIIQTVQVTCGCTTPKWTTNKKYGPGEKMEVTLGFNGAIKGSFSKSVTLFFSGGLQKIVTFHGETFEAKADSTMKNR